MQILSLNQRNFLGALAIILTLSLPALSQAGEIDRLTGVLPEGNKVVIAVDMNAMRSTFVYKDGYEWFKSQAAVGPMLELLEQTASFDVNKDLHAVVFSSPELPTSLDKADALPFTVAVAGKFNQADLIAAARERLSGVAERKEGNVSVFRSENVEFGFLNDTTFVMGTGPDDFLKRIWTGTAARGQRNRSFTSLKTEVGANQHVWILLDTRGANAATGPRTEWTAMGFKFTPGLEVTVLSKMENADGAKTVAEQTEVLKTTAGSDPMVAMLGLAPLVQNLTVTHKEKDVRMASTMTEGQTRALVTRVQGILRRSGDLQRGITPGATRPAAPQPPQDKPADSTAPSRQGAPADFN
jgi:hypothetical protein